MTDYDDLLRRLREWGNLPLVTGDRPWQIACREAADAIESLREELRIQNIANDMLGAERDAWEKAAKGKRVWWLPWPPQEVARRFHLAYEQFAPDFGYETRPDTKVFDPYSPNGQLMIAVVRNVLIEQASNRIGDLEKAEAERDALRRFYDDFWSHAVGTDGDADYWAIPKNELEVAEDAVKAVDALLAGKVRRGSDINSAPTPEPESP